MTVVNKELASVTKPSKNGTSASVEQKLIVQKLDGRWVVTFVGRFTRKDVNALWRLIFRQFKRDGLKRRISKVKMDRETFKVKEPASGTESAAVK